MTDRCRRMPGRCLAVPLASALVLTSPGLGAYQALAQRTLARPAAVRPSNVVRPAPGFPARALGAGDGYRGVRAPRPSPSPSPSPGISARFPMTEPYGEGMPPPGSVGKRPTGPVRETASSPGSAPAVRWNVDSPGIHAGLAPAAAMTAGKVGGLGAELEGLLRNAGDISRAQPAAAHAVGRGAQAVMTRERLTEPYGEGTRPSPSARECRIQGLLESGPPSHAADGALSSPRTFVTLAGASSLPGAVAFARPAGNSLQPAMGRLPAEPAVPSPPDDGSGGGSGIPSDGPGRAPIWSRLLSSGALFLVPAVFLAWPLFQAGFVASAALLTLSAALNGTMPFMGERSPRWLRASPGLALAGLGLFLLAGAVSAFTWTGLAMGSVAALGGWGLWRFALGKSRAAYRGYDGPEVLYTFLASFAAVSGAGLVLLSPAGWASLLTYAAMPASAPLFMHLPGWIGDGMEAMFHVAGLGAWGVHRVLSSIRGDTALWKRLIRYTEASVRASPWNAFWLGLLVWLPAGALEGSKAVLAAASGLALGALQSPVLFAWGAAHALRDKHGVFMKLAVRLGGWTHGFFGFLQGSKVRLFNPLEKRLIPYANSGSLIVGMAGASAIGLWQMAWLSFILAGSPMVMAVTFFRAFNGPLEPYDPQKHSPRHLSLDKDELPGQVPEEPRPDRGLRPLWARLLTFGIALLPLYFFAVPALLASSAPLAVLYAATAAAIAAAPLLANKADSARRLLLPGVLLLASGAATAFLGHGVVLGVVSALGGLGFLNYVNRAGRESETLDDLVYVLAFVGALGLSTSLLAAAAGIGGPAGVLAYAGYATSPAVLVHLPRWSWRGVRRVLEGVLQDRRGIHQVLSFWRSDTRFDRNMRGFYRYWMRKSVWTGAWVVFIPWLGSLLAKLAEHAAAAAASFWLFAYGLVAVSFFRLDAGGYLMSGLAALITLPHWSDAAYASNLIALSRYHGGSLAAGLSAVWNFSLLGVSVSAAVSAYLALRLLSRFLWGAADSVNPDARFAKFMAGFVRSLRENAEGSKKTAFDPYVARLIPAIDDRTEGPDESGRPTLKAALALGASRLIQLAWLVRLVAWSPVFVLRAARDAWRNATVPPPAEK